MACQAAPSHVLFGCTQGVLFEEDSPSRDFRRPACLDGAHCTSLFADDDDDTDPPPRQTVPAACPPLHFDCSPQGEGGVSAKGPLGADDDFNAPWHGATLPTRTPPRRKRRSRRTCSDEDDMPEAASPEGPRCYTHPTHPPPSHRHALPAVPFQHWDMTLAPAACTAPLGVTFGRYSHIGSRKSQEDAMHIEPSVGDGVAYAAVFDGHCGDVVSRHCAESVHNHIAAAPGFAAGAMPRAMVEGLRHADVEMRGLLDGGACRGGATALVACLHGRDLTVANIGDCRAVLVCDGGATVVPLSKDHSAGCPGEQARVHAAGGVICENRFQGDLAVARALGDFSYKPDDVASGTCALSNVADIATCRVTDRCDFLLLASDGLWDVMSSDAAAAFVALRLGLEPRCPPTAAPFASAIPASTPVVRGATESECRTPRSNLQAAVEALTLEAVCHTQNTDNVTCVAMGFHAGL